METTVKVKCLSKKNALSYNGANPICCSIELAVPYDQTSIFYQMSGGTAMTLNTINDDAAQNIGIKNPLPRTASSSVYWIYAAKHKLTYKVTPASQVLLGAKVNPAATGIFKHGAYRRDGTFAGHADVVIRQIDRKRYYGLDGNTTESDKDLKSQFEGGQSSYKTRVLGVPSFLVMGFIEVR